MSARGTTGNSGSPLQRFCQFCSLPTFIDGIAPSFPEIQPQSYSPLGAQAGLDNYIVPQTIYTTSLDFTKAKGKHTLAFGFMDVWARIDGGHYANTVLQFQTTSTAGPNPQQATANTGNGFASFLLGVGSGNDSTGIDRRTEEKRPCLWGEAELSSDDSGESQDLRCPAGA